MNLLNKTTVRFYLSIILLIVMTMITNIAQAQKQYTTLSKNINPEAQGLIHELSPEGDSLYLKSESIFYKVTFLNSLDRKVYKFNPPVLESKISLHDIIVGDYTVLVYKSDRIIVFHISRLLEIDRPMELFASQEISIDKLQSLIQPTLLKIRMKESTNSKAKMNEINMDQGFELENNNFKLAVNDAYMNGPSNVSNSMQAYNLSSSDRSQMQSREDYRRNNLRPNGRPYN